MSGVRATAEPRVWRRGVILPHLSTVPWHIYLARCADDSLYTGVSTDPHRRIQAHNRGRGAAYTRGRGPVRLVYREAAADRSAALRREWAIKQLSRAAKERLIRSRSPEGEEWMSSFERFRPAALDFFRRLRRRNTKEWFAANRPLYEREVREPLRGLIEEVDVRLARSAPEIIGDPRRSPFRINRDIRFSPDKSPYKTHASCWFYHRDAGRGVGTEAESGGAGFYFHFSPEESLTAGGIWMPARSALARIRDALAEDPDGLSRIVRGPGFRRRFGALSTEAMLTRLPRGFAPSHPAERWLRYQSFTASRLLSRRELMSPRLPDILARDYQALTPLVRWLNRALGLPSASRRV